MVIDTCCWMFETFWSLLLGSDRGEMGGIAPEGRVIWDESGPLDIRF